MPAFQVCKPAFYGHNDNRKFFYHYRIAPVSFIPLARIPSGIRYMALALEDSTFYKNNGIDISAISSAYKEDRAMKRMYFGASTITQQLSRTLFLTPDKSFLRKYLEAITALEMNTLIPKNRVLELYLNYAEWGKGIPEWVPLPIIITGKIPGPLTGMKWPDYV